jgi:hypothetical protein
MNLSPRATAVHPAARFVGMAWKKATFNCWHMVQAVELEVFGKVLPDIPIDSTDDKTAAILAATAGWHRVEGPPTNGDILTMIGPQGPHVGVWINGRVLHNLGYQDEHGVDHGSVGASDLRELGLLNYGHVKLWRAK